MKIQYHQKIRVALLLLFIGACITAEAQHAFHVYRHNGTVNSFFYADCDSITYTRMPQGTDAQTAEFVQLIHTPDSVFQIPVNEIDSVSFYKPKTVYKPGVIKLEEQLFPYIVEHDSLTLIFSSQTPSGLLPKQGDNLVTLETNQTFPSGFFGKVIEVNKTGNNYRVRCEPPLLTDIFSSYYYEGCVDIQTAEANKADKQTMAKAAGDIVWPPVDHQFTLPDISLSLNAGTLGLNSGPFSSSVSQTFGYTMESKIRLRTSLRVDNGVHFHLTMTGNHALTTSISASVEGTVSPEFDATIPIPIPIAPGIVFYISSGPFVYVSGSFNGEYNQTHYFNSAIHYEYDHGSPSNIPAQIKIVPQGQNEAKGDFYGNLSFKFGLFCEMGVALASKELAKAGIAFEEGVAIDVKMDLGGAGISSPPNTSVYDKYKDTDLLTFSLYAGSEFRLKALYAEASVGIESALGAPFLQIGIVPNFNGVKAGMSKNNLGELYATADVSGRCFGSHRVGFALYHKDKLLDKAYYKTPYDGKTPLTISHIFKGLSPEKQYTVYPIIELFGNSGLLATPSSKTELEIKVLTGASQHVTAQAATLMGRVEGIDSTIPCEYGISYCPEGTQDWINVPSAAKGGGDFSCTIHALTPNTGYSYRAYLQLNGQMMYGATHSFRTKKEEVPYEVITEGVRNLTSSSAILEGIVKGIEASVPSLYGIAYKQSGQADWIQMPANSHSYGRFACQATGLSPDTEYEYRAYLHADGKDFWGMTRHFKTETADLEPSVLAVLQEFYDSTDGNRWYNHNNWFEESQLQWWYGFSPSYEKDGVYHLNLDNNNLSGHAILRNSNFIANMSLAGNPIQSLTVESCEGLSQLTLPGQGETLHVANCALQSGTSDSNPNFLTIESKQNGHFKYINVSQSAYNSIRLDGYLSRKNIHVDRLDYAGADQNFTGYLRGGLDTTVGQLNLSQAYNGVSISFHEIGTLNIGGVYPTNENNMIGRWDIGYENQDGHIQRVNVDQAGKLPFSMHFYQQVDVANIRNMSQPTSGTSSGHTFFYFEKGANEINIENLQLQSTMCSIWTPTPTTVNVVNSSFYLSDFSTPSADNVFNFVNCDVSTDVDGTTKRLHNLTFKGTASQLREYLKEHGR